MKSWGTLRFDVHRGLLPRDFKVSETGLLAKLTRSKVSGPDKQVNFRAVVIHSSACVQHKNWLSVGWELLQKGAPHERDCLLPTPSNNFRGFKTKELKSATAFAVQTQVISLASYRGLRIFQSSTGHYYTPHSGRNFMLSDAAVLGSAKLTVISSEDGHPAKFKIAQMQSAIAATFRNPDTDQLGEADDIDDLGDFLRAWEVPESSVLRTKKILCSRTFSDLESITYPEPSAVDSELAAGEIILGDIDEEAAMKKVVQAETAIGQPRTLRIAWFGPQASPSRDPLEPPRGLLYFPFGEEGHTCTAFPWSLLHVVHLLLVVLRSRIHVLTTMFASGVQSRLSFRTFPDHLRQTLPHPAMIEVYSAWCTAVRQSG